MTKSTTILYIDEESINLSSFKEICPEAYDVILASSSKEGSNALETHDIALLIINRTTLEKDDNPDFLKKIATIWTNTVFIVLTTYTDSKSFEKILSNTCVYRYLNTPFENNGILSIISLSLQNYHLKKSQQKLNLIIDSSLDAIITINEQQNIIMANEGATNMFGYNKTELLNKPLNFLIPKGSRLNYGKLFNDFAHSKKQNKFMQVDRTIYGLSSSGQKIPIEAILSKVKIGHKIYFNAIIRNIEDRVQKEAKLVKSENLLKEAQKIGKIGYWERNFENDELIWSDQLYKIFGFDSNNFTTTYTIFLETVHPDDIEEVKANYNLSLQNKTSYSINYRIILKSGKLKSVNERCKNIYDKEGNPKRSIGTVQDITKQEKTKQALESSNNEFKELFENALDEIYLINPVDMKILALNNIACKHTGYSKKELIGQELAKVIAPADFIKNLDTLTNVLEGKAETCIANHLSKKNKCYPVEIKVKLIQYKNKKTLLLMAQDISNRKKIEKELLESQQHLFSINDNTPDLIITINKYWIVTYINRVLTGFNRKDVISSNILTFIPKTSHQQYKEHLRKAFNNEKQEFELEGYSKGRVKTWYSVRMSVLKGNSQNQSLLIISTDITKIKKTALYNSITNSISRKLNSNIIFNDFCQYIFIELQKIKPFPNLSITSYNTTTKELSPLFWVTNNIEQTEYPSPRVKGNGLCEYIIKTKNIFLLTGKEVDIFYKKNNLTLYGEISTSCIGVPLVSEGNIVGALTARTYCLEEEYTNADLDLLSFIGNQVGYLLEKNKAEKEIKQFEKHFSVSMDLLCIANTNGFFEKINPKFSEVLGYSEEKLLAVSLLNFVHPDDIEATQEEINNLSEKIPTINFMNRYLCKNGVYKYFVWTANSDATSNKIYAAARDVTEQIKTQQILTALSEVQNEFIENSSAKKTFEKMLSTLLNVTQSGYGFIGEILYKDSKPYLKSHAITDVFWNKETASFYKENATKGLEFHNMKTLFGQVISTGKAVISNDPYHDPRRGGLPPGHPHMGSFLGLPFYNNKELVGMVGIASKPDGYSEKDIELLEPFLATCSTLIKAFQTIKKGQQIEKKVKKLANIVSHSSDAIISTNKEGKIVSWNLGAKKLLGYCSKEVLNTSIIKLRPDILKEEHDKIILDIKLGKSIKSYDTLQVKKGGTLVPVNMSIFPLIDEKGNFKGISTILRDISTQKEAELIKEEFTKTLELKVNERTKALKEAQKKLALSLEKEKELGELKSRFVSIASHQFRTPLTVIQSSMGILALQNDDMNDKFSATFNKVYNRVERQIIKMTSLMNQVLILGKINTLNVRTTVKPTDLIALCKNIIANHNGIQVDGRRLVLSINGSPYKIKIDAKLIEDAISNLISNAFKYSANKPAPSLTINFEKDTVQLSIKDDGIGVPSKDLKHLFDPFFRASNVTGLSGTGLGTAIAKEYVELNGGTISATSKLNKGSEFIITLKKA
jgi:PAS domain S-box-containing protein